MILQSLNNKTREARQAKNLEVQLASSAARDLRETPAKRHPNIEQVQGQSHQQKAQSRIGRSGPAPHLISTAIASFDSLYANDKKGRVVHQA